MLYPHSVTDMIGMMRRCGCTVYDTGDLVGNMNAHIQIGHYLLMNKNNHFLHFQGEISKSLLPPSHFFQAARVNVQMDYAIHRRYLENLTLIYCICFCQIYKASDQIISMIQSSCF